MITEALALVDTGARRSWAGRVRRPWRMAAAGLLAACSIACGTPNSQAAASSPPAAAAPAAAPQAATPAASGGVTIAQAFPPGPGRDAVLDKCGSCHAVACSALGQRTAERWDAIRAAHRDRFPNTSDADLDAMFGYLKAHFNDKTPEPKIAPEFVQQGCTPF